MEYKYKTYSEIFKKNACTHIQDNREKIEDLIITYWKPLNFKGNTFNFLLRDNHVATIPMHNNFFKTVARKWINDLGFSEQYFFEEVTKKIKDNETFIKSRLIKLDLGKKQEIETKVLINKQDKEETKVLVI